MELDAIIKGENVITAAYVLIFLAVFVLARMLLQEQELRAAQENLDDKSLKKSSNPLVNLTKPFLKQYFVPMIRARPFFEKMRVKYRRKVISGGLKDEITADEFVGLKMILVLFFPIVGAFLKAGDFIDFSNWVILGTGVAGWFYPDFWVNGKIKNRHKLVIRAMPFIVDLLALSTEAGLDFIGAIGKVVEKANPSPLVDEFSQLLKEIKVGSSRREAMREMSLRINMPEVNSFIAILISADQMGASIGKILRQQSEQMRVDRMLRAEKAGATASQMIILPTIIFILPAVGLMIFGPFVVGFMISGGPGF